MLLPGGGEVPRHMPGRWLVDQVRAWHEQNPNQKAAVGGPVGQMMFAIADSLGAPPTPAPALATYANNQQSVLVSEERSMEEHVECLAQHLALANDILEKKRGNKKPRQVFDGVVITSLPPKKTTKKTVRLDPKVVEHEADAQDTTGEDQQTPEEPSDVADADTTVKPDRMRARSPTTEDDDPTLPPLPFAAA